MIRWLSERLAYWATRIGMRLAVLAVKIVPHRIIYRITDTVAAAAFHSFRGFRIRSQTNLRIALGNDLPDTRIRRLAQDSLKNFFRAFVELPIVLAADTGELRHMMSITGCDNLDAAVAKGNGVVLLSAHLGNFFLLGARLALDDYAIHVLVNQPRHGRFAELMDQYRLQVLQKTIPARPRRQAFKQVVQVLRRNEVVIMIADEYRRTGSGVRVPFFGRSVLARRGPVTVALRTRAAIVPAYVIRRSDNKLQLIIEPEIELLRSERDKPQIVENILRITAWLEKTVRSHPDQWNWMNIKWDDPAGSALPAQKHRLERLTQ
jgi:KDO2-lipid IV(A) lauroyltransferase